MRIQRYFAEDMRQALRKVRDAQGPDAVILSSRKVEGGVEVVSAVDFDEADLLRPAAPAGNPDLRASPRPAAARQVGGGGDADRPGRDPADARKPELNAVREELHSIRSLLERQLSGLAWGELGRRQPHRAALLRRLAGMELDPRVVREVVAEVPATAQLELAWRHALAILSHRIDAGDDDLLDRGGVVALVGSTGVGKTTTVAKLAARFALRHGADQVALLTTDSFRVGAVEQLRTYARLMGVPVRVAGGRAELRASLDDVSDRRLVLIDTAGMSQRDIRLSEQLALIRDGLPVVRAYVVLSAAAQRLALEEVVSAFRGAPLEGCILTKLDEATSLGGALSVVAAHRLRVAYVSDGQRVPEDLRPARAHQLVSRAVGSIPRRNPAYDDESLELTYGALSAAGQL